MDLKKEQICPYCGHEVDDSHAEWEEGDNTVECDRCDKKYFVSPQYEFLGFEIEKYCDECEAAVSECYCDDESVDEEIA